MPPSTVGTAFDKLFRALHVTDPNAPDGGHYLAVQGTINIIGAGSGGTSQIDNSSFIPGASSLTPIGGYVGGRTVASGNTAAPAMNASGMLIVAVGAGGAGGGLAQLQVVGSDNSTFQNVGYPSGGSPSLNAVPVNVLAGGLATVNIAGQPISIVGSINPHGIFGSVSMVGSVGVTPLATFSVNLVNIPTVNLGTAPTVNIGNNVTVTGTVTTVGAGGGGFASVAVYGSPATPVYVIGSVNVVNQAANSGFASVAVYGSPANPVYVQFPSGYFPTVNSAGGGAGGGFASVAVYGSPAMPVYVIGSVNVVNGGTGFASVAVYGSPANPVYNVGSVNVVNAVAVNAPGGSLQIVGSVNPHGVFAPAGSINVVGSVGATQLGAPWTMVGSINATNLGGSVGVTQITSPWVVDPRAGITGTQWPISHTGSGYLAIAIASANPAVRVKIHAVQITAENSAVVSFQSPSGTFLTGSIRIPGAAGFNLAVGMPSHLWIGATNATFYMQAIGSQNIGGWLSGWVE